MNQLLQIVYEGDFWCLCSVTFWQFFFEFVTHVNTSDFTVCKIFWMKALQKCCFRPSWLYSYHWWPSKLIQNLSTNECELLSHYIEVMQGVLWNTNQDLGLFWAGWQYWKKKIGADYKQLLRAVFSCFEGEKHFLFFFESASALKIT